jgi:hypothetical protein
MADIPRFNARSRQHFSDHGRAEVRRCEILQATAEFADGGAYAADN